MKRIPYPNLVRPVVRRDGHPSDSWKGKYALRSNIEHAFRRYFAVVFPLLVVAAGIETALILGLQ